MSAVSLDVRNDALGRKGLEISSRRSETAKESHGYVSHCPTKEEKWTHLEI
jgi:hypothetical protein